MTEVYIVRHGNTFGPGDTVLRVGGGTDLPLVEKGLEQARALATHFAGQEIRFDEVWTSPLSRTRTTAEIIAEATAPGCEIRAADFLREIDYGPDEGQPEDDVLARIGAKALSDWETQSIVPPGWKVNVATLREDWQRFFEGTRERAPERALVVTSNGVARFALDVTTGTKEDVSRKLRTGAYGRITLAPDGTTLLEDWDLRP